MKELNLQYHLKKNDLLVMVDDNEIDRTVAKRYFQYSKLECDFLQFDSGEAFLKYLNDAKAKKEKMPSIVMLDINMPVLNGFEVLSKVKEDDFFKETPKIIMFSTASDERNISQALQLGANDFATKPSRRNDYISFFNSLSA